MTTSICVVVIRTLTQFVYIMSVSWWKLFIVVRMAARSCFLKACLNCSGSSGDSNYITVSVKRLMQASKRRDDDLHQDLLEQKQKMYFVIGTVFLHTRLGHTLNDIYAEQLKLKRNQLKNVVVVMEKHSVLEITAFFMVRNLSLCLIQRIQIVGVEWSNVEQLIVDPHTNNLRIQFWRYVTSEMMNGRTK